jgi:hypothetical protein
MLSGREEEVDGEAGTRGERREAAFSKKPSKREQNPKP